MLEVLHVPTLVDNYVWLIKQPNQHPVVIVDPGEAWPVAYKLESEGLNPVAILVTHHHHDHTGGLDELRSQFSIPVYGPDHIRQVTHPVNEGDTVPVPELNTSLDVLDVRGHTREHLAYTTDKLLFCGDVIFSAGCGRQLGGTLEQMWAAISRLASLPDETVVYCGHEYTLANLKFAATVEPGNTAITDHQRWADKQRKSRLPTLPTTIGKEKLINPFLRLDVDSVRQAAKARTPDINDDDPLQVFIALRRWKDSFRG